MTIAREMIFLGRLGPLFGRERIDVSGLAELKESN